jgi:small subunit ribosomal protein S20
VANIKSQIKRNKQNEKAHQRNKAAKSSLRTSVRKFREAADGGNVSEAETALRAACREPGREPQVGDSQALRRTRAG